MIPAAIPSCILIFDVEPDNRKRWKAALEGAGFRVVEAANRVDAIILLRDAASGIDLLVTSVMNDCAGGQLASDAVELRPALRVILIAEAAYPVGIHDTIAILLEPVSDSELIGTVQALLPD